MNMSLPSQFTSTDKLTDSEQKMPNFLEKYFPDWLSANPFFSAGFGMIIMTSGLSMLKYSTTSLQSVARRKSLISLEIPSRDPSYQWVMQYIINTQKGQAFHLGVETSQAKDARGRTQTSFDFVPSPGKHFFKFNKKWFMVDRERSGGAMDFNSGTPFESLTLTTISLYGPNVFAELLRDARLASLQKEDGRTIVYNVTGHEWRPFGLPRKVRPFDSVILHGNVSQAIYNDVVNFISNPTWYVDRGIPYRRGYLLHGPPGCGKTSYVMALAGQLKYNIAVINLGDAGMSDDRLAHVLSTAPPDCLILLEDIDSVIPKDYIDKTSEDNANPNYQYNRLTISGLLNALDGVIASEERIIIMTTNYINRLPPALLRPGRVDIQVYIGMSSREQLLNMFKRFYPDASLDEQNEFGDILEGLSFSMAEIQGYFMCFKDNLEACLANLPNFAEARREQMNERNNEKNNEKNNDTVFGGDAENVPAGVIDSH